MKMLMCVRVADSYTWSSYLRIGALVAHDDKTLSVRMEDTVELTSHLSEKGRGAELSELIVFNGKLYTVDDRSGIGKWVSAVILLGRHHVFLSSPCKILS